MDSLIGKTLGQYQILEEIGRGGMAVVYKAHQPALERYVAIKVLPQQFTFDREFVERFLREARAAARLNHPHIVTIHDVGQAGGTYYIVMEYLKGPSLVDLLRQRGALPPQQAAQVVAQVASALDYAHQQGFVHRDVKPSNVLLGAGGVAKLTDFGIVKAAEGTRLTQTGTLLGTPEYMSPEQAKGLGVDHRTDIYSLGVVAYEMLTGRVPFQAESTLALLHKVAYDPLPPIRHTRPDLPAGVEEVLAKALAKEPDERYGTVSAFVDALGRALELTVEDRFQSATEMQAALVSLDTASVIWVPSTRKQLPIHGDRIRRDNVANLRLIKQWECLKRILHLVFSPDALALAICCPDEIIVHCLAGGREHSIQTSANSLAYSPDARLLASGGDVCRIWDTDKWNQVRKIRQAVQYLAFSPDGELLATASKTVQLWNAKSGRRTRECLHSKRYIGQRGVGHLSFSADGRLLAGSGEIPDLIQVWDTSSGREAYRLVPVHEAGVGYLRFSPVGQILAATVMFGRLVIWDLSTGKWWFLHPGDSLFSLGFDPTGDLLATARSSSEDTGGTVELIDLTTSETLIQLSMERKDCIAVDFSSDGRFLAAASWGGTVRLWGIVGD